MTAWAARPTSDPIKASEESGPHQILCRYSSYLAQFTLVTSIEQKH
jgi:hypothetical protein